MENHVEDGDFLPNHIKQADFATQYAYVLKEYSNSIVNEKAALEAVIETKSKRKGWQQKVNMYMKAFEESEDDAVIRVPAAPTKTVNDIVSTNPPAQLQIELDQKKHAEATKQVKTGAKRKDESWPAACERAIGVLDRASTNESVCAFLGVSSTDLRKTVRSAIKYLRSRDKLIGIAYYVPPTILGKSFRKVFVNARPEFYENNDSSTGILKANYQHALDNDVKEHGWITLEEVEQRGGSIINED